MNELHEVYKDHAGVMNRLLDCANDISMYGGAGEHEKEELGYICAQLKDAWTRIEEYITNGEQR